MIAAIWFSLIIGPAGMVFLHRSAPGRQHPRIWRRSAGAGMAVLAATVALSRARISLADPGLAGAVVLLCYCAVLASMLVASSSRKEWVASISWIAYLAVAWTSFVVALPGYPAFDFLTSGPMGPRFFHADLGEGLSCEANGRGGLDDFARIRLYRRLTESSFLVRDRDTKLEAAVTVDPEATCRRMVEAQTARPAGASDDR